MSAQPARHLRIVDPETGELHDQCPNCAALVDQLAGADKEIRAWRSRYAALARDKEAEAKGHELWPQALELFDYWREKCSHAKSKWTADRFWLVFPFLRDEGLGECKRAVDGAAYQPWTKPLRRGGIERFDFLETIFKNRGAFERMRNRAPKEAK